MERETRAARVRGSGARAAARRRPCTHLPVELPQLLPGDQHRAPLHGGIQRLRPASRGAARRRGRERASSTGASGGGRRAAAQGPAQRRGAALRRRNCCPRSSLQHGERQAPLGVGRLVFSLKSHTSGAPRLLRRPQVPGWRAHCCGGRAPLLASGKAKPDCCWRPFFAERPAPEAVGQNGAGWCWAAGSEQCCCDDGKDGRQRAAAATTCTPPSGECDSKWPRGQGTPPAGWAAPCCPSQHPACTQCMRQEHMSGTYHPLCPNDRCIRLQNSDNSVP